MVIVWSVIDNKYVIVKDTDKLHIWMLIYMDTDEGMMMVWICIIEEYWIGLKILYIYELIKDICWISSIYMKEQCTCKI